MGTEGSWVVSRDVPALGGCVVLVGRELSRLRVAMPSLDTMINITALQLIANSAFHVRFGIVLASSLDDRPTSGGLWAAAGRPIR